MSSLSIIITSRSSELRLLGDAVRELAVQTAATPTASPATIADSLGVPPRVVKRAFHLAHGQSLQSFLAYRRLLAAERLMTELSPTEATLDVLASRSGFRSRKELNTVHQHHRHSSAYGVWLRVAPVGTPSER